jgi:hypothetical protein
VWGPDGDEVDYGEWDEGEIELTGLKADLQVLFPHDDAGALDYLIENVYDNIWMQDLLLRQIGNSGRNELTERILRALGADDAGIDEFFNLYEEMKPELEITVPEQDISPVSDTVTPGMPIQYSQPEGPKIVPGLEPDPKQMSLDEYILMRIVEDQIPISSIDFSSPENALFHNPAMRKNSPGMEEEYQKWVRQTDAIAEYTEEYRGQVGEGTFAQQIGATIIGRNPLLPLPLLEKIIQPGGSWEKAKNASVEDKIVTALTIAGLSAWALGKPLSILFGNARGALQEAKLAAEFKNTNFYRRLAPELQGSALERDIYNVYKIYRSGIKGATVEESDNIAGQMMARIYNDVKAGKYGDFDFGTWQKPPAEPAQPVKPPQLGPGGEIIPELKPTPPPVKFTATDPETFISARNQSKRPQFIAPYAMEQLKDAQLFLSEDGKVGYALTSNKDLINLFNNSGIRGAAEEAVIQAIVNGAETLDCYDGFLVGYYTKLGFREYKRAAWDDEYAPANWNYERDGRPDVVFMRYEGKTRNADDIRKSLRVTGSEGTSGRTPGPGGYPPLDRATGGETRGGLGEAEQAPPDKRVEHDNGQIVTEEGNIKSPGEPRGFPVFGELNPSPQYTDPTRMEAVNNLNIDTSSIEYINAIRQISEENLDALENQIIQVTGIDPSEIRIIDTKIFDKKIERFNRQGKDPKSMPDVITARIDVDEKDLYLYRDKIKKGFNYINEKQYFNTPTNPANRSIYVNVRLPSGIFAQIQIYAISPMTPREITPKIVPELQVKLGYMYDMIDKGILTREVIDNLRISNDVAQRVKNAMKIDVRGWTYTIDADFFRHALGGHGLGYEWRTDQVAISKEDFQQVPEIMRNPDKIQKGKTEDGKDGIIFVKHVDGTIYYFQIVGADRKHLIAWTMWKKIK